MLTRAMAEGFYEYVTESHLCDPDPGDEHCFIEQTRREKIDESMVDDSPTLWLFPDPRTSDPMEDPPHIERQKADEGYFFHDAKGQAIRDLILDMANQQEENRLDLTQSVEAMKKLLDGDLDLKDTLAQFHLS